MRRLMLLRHAKSDWPQGISDHDRSITKRGQRQSTEIGEYMAGQGLVPELAIISTARRAQETWQLVHHAFMPKIIARNDSRIYEASKEDLLRIIKETEPSVRVLLLVGHNPGFEQLAKLLAGTGRPSALSRLGQGYPTAGLVVIDAEIDSWTEASVDCGYLERFETLAP